MQLDTDVHAQCQLWSKHLHALAMERPFQLFIMRRVHDLLAQYQRLNHRGLWQR
jgi:hypothetical protein